MENTIECKDFDWEELVGRIVSKNIIPVIGQGLYQVEKMEGGNVLLYDYLAEKLAEKIGYTLPPNLNHKFSKMAFEFLRRNDSGFKTFMDLNRFLMDILKTIKLKPDNRLRKLARIKAFNLFINTSYDDFLVNTLKITRSHPCIFLNYTLRERKLNQLTNELFDSLDESECTLVYNIYGNFREKISPSFTENDILETIVLFQKDMELNQQNRLFQKLKGNSLLFMGCGYDDWLFRFFIRTVSNQPYRYPKDPMFCKFVSDDFEKNKINPIHELHCFLSNYDSQVYHTCNGQEFVDILFEKIEQYAPEEIIQVSDFPETAFISFTGENRATALLLAAKLRSEGIKVWVDDNEFEPGDEIDATIINAIATCPVFIPLISKESKKLFLENGNMKYHCREWNWVYIFNKKTGNPQKTIIPVIIDDTDWMYDQFKELCYIKIPGGSSGEYERLKKFLMEFRITSDI